MNTSQLVKNLFENRGGIEKHNLNNVIQLLSKNDDHQETFATSNYYDIDSMLESFNRNKCDFSTLTLNIDGINTKFDQLTALITCLWPIQISLSAFAIQDMINHGVLCR